jgi:hypothetical protein
LRRPGAAATASFALAVAGCATLPDAPPRLAATPLACMRATVAAKVPPELGDKHKHCLAAGMIARHCSVSEAKLASWGKELGDALGNGDADRDDLDADYAGIGCARAALDDAALQSCCAGLYPEPGHEPGREPAGGSR